MKVLINLISIKKGGGLQVASNFLEQLKDEKCGFEFVFLATSNSYIHEKLNEIGKWPVYVVKNTLLHRILFLKYTVPRIIKLTSVDIIYTLFGPGLFSPGVISVTGCAYSNLFFPEIDFWQGNSFFRKLWFKIRDKYRLANTLKSDVIIFENSAMEKRAQDLFKVPPSRTKLILPSISQYPQIPESNNIWQRLKIIDHNHFNILMLTGWHKNKNIEIVPEVLVKLQEKGINNVRFIITVPPRHQNSLALIQAAKAKGVHERILLFDSVKPYEVPPLFSRIQAVMLLSLLESFSNNIIEAWHFSKPLFISNEEWARAICKKAAIYVNRDNAFDISKAIRAYLSDTAVQSRLLQESSIVLKDYPSPRQKVNLQLVLLKDIYINSESLQ